MADDPLIDAFVVEVCYASGNSSKHLFADGLRERTGELLAAELDGVLEGE